MNDHPNNLYEDDTLSGRPVPRRPRWGWSAWEATTGYIAQHHSPDATLKLQLYNVGQNISFTSSCAWGEHREEVRFADTMGEALRQLWLKIYHNHPIFESVDDAFRSPVGYDEYERLDDTTQDVFDRLVLIVQKLFEHDWLLIIVYRPVENPETRLQMRLLAESNSVQRASQGSTLREVCRSLLHHCATLFAERNPLSDSS
jgi:hypothetical protein